MNSLNYLPDTLTEFEIESLLKQPNLNCPTGFRNYTLINLILNTGAKLAEIINLTWGKIDLKYNKIRFDSDKVIKHRNIIISQTISQILITWRNKQIEEVGKANYVFTTLSNNPLSSRYINIMLKRYADKAFIFKNVTAYTLRHTYGLKIYRQTNDLSTVKYALGITDNEYVKIYKKIAEKEDSIYY